ncbi:MAG: tRNA (adenosine(37)-N6)-threonylcarbamoyltransferase complex ATPase subunit type 1 TsaE [Ignavibacteriaceae bacterium]
MSKEIRRISASENDTSDFAKELAAEIHPGDVVALVGDLGSGKTFFTKAFCQSIGINYVTSPTFTIVNTYSVDGHKVYHFDFYRINSINELLHTGFNDYIHDQEAIIFIEWADLFRKALPSKRVEINFIMNNDLTRTIVFTRYD